MAQSLWRKTIRLYEFANKGITWCYSSTLSAGSLSYINDIFVLGVVYAQIQSYSEKYKLWKDNIA